jgi:hypothetical protein
MRHETDQHCLLSLLYSLSAFNGIVTAHVVTKKFQSNNLPLNASSLCFNEISIFALFRRTNSPFELFARLL